MKVSVDFYKDTGKWYSSCEIIVNPKMTWDTDYIKKEVLEKQTALQSVENFEGYCVVCEHNDENGFCRRLFKCAEFKF